ncbi:4-amino-4-deoxy-L-arabinose-phosphoundecaprenol flippase subunit ArnF [Pseudomonas corrugata]|uniref:Probable 4-amino-4-deoxy-L-arabinose-phosphoundecaprenol flippase subunit ArnF n=1 Tax=Pseudomonas corrugata TaxID=47879 RepID=A0A8B6UYB3_9PSED|nr:4-amino-4-deoxy-L-arabinose-phosphoundecaprenol flippase subunit ArnF [Pseudomonas corrugata]QTH16890.1 4-amino-4-deoxy-L-arabinose-phosphoundecaprenol flippase subunit ArnF [Pseudomonas corrugata]
MNLRRGVIFALGSVLLVSIAQLALRWSMSRLPLPGQWLAGSVDPMALVVVLGAIFAYALSMLCWLFALRDLPLGRAYSLLSISYALVYLLAAALPLFNESFSLSKSLGVTLVILGVLTINSRPVQASESRKVV